MPSIDRCKLPEQSLLAQYRDSDAYTDCYTAEVSGNVLLSDFIRVFYSTLPFRLERRILTWAASKPSSDEDVQRLAEARTDRFAAWEVEARDDNQLLMSDYQGRTRSWLMVQPSTDSDEGSTRLFFGSAVVPIRDKQTGERRMGLAFSVLLPFHKLYSRVLLSSAKSGLSP